MEITRNSLLRKRAIDQALEMTRKTMTGISLTSELSTLYNVYCRGTRICEKKPGPPICRLMATDAARRTKPNNANRAALAREARSRSMNNARGMANKLCLIFPPNMHNATIEKIVQLLSGGFSGGRR